MLGSPMCVYPIESIALKDMIAFWTYTFLYIHH